MIEEMGTPLELAPAVSSTTPRFAFVGADWMTQAACKGMDTELFFPPRGVPAHPSTIEACRRCEVRAECGEYGVREKFGRWGGLPEVARRSLRRGRSR